MAEGNGQNPWQPQVCQQWISMCLQPGIGNLGWAQSTECAADGASRLPVHTWATSNGWEKLGVPAFPRALVAEEFCLVSGTLRGPIKAPHPLCPNTSQALVNSSPFMALQVKEFILLKYPWGCQQGAIELPEHKTRCTRSPWDQCVLPGVKLLQLHRTGTQSSPSTGRRLWSDTRLMGSSVCPRIIIRALITTFTLILRGGGLVDNSLNSNLEERVLCLTFYLQCCGSACLADMPSIHPIPFHFSYRWGKLK